MALRRSFSYVKFVAFRSVYGFFENAGIHITPVHFYEPIPDSRELRKRERIWESETELVGIDMDVPRQLSLLREIFPSFKQEYEFPGQKTRVPFEFYLENGMFEAVDAEVAHCMVRHFLPKKIIEIGSGFSTRLLARACLLNKEKAGRETRLFTIDPYPGDIVARGFPGLTSLTREKAENIDLAFLLQLNEGDILFIDSSHVARIGSDVNYLFPEVLPRLKPGVIVHVHDIFLPREYPREWVLGLRRSWNEQYLLQAFLTYNQAYTVLWCGSYMHLHHLQELKTAFPSYNGLIYPKSFWMRRKPAAD
ncbi:MAG: class I SAM-dependent methyltransferase [Dehalococcoidales bacterium]|nr:class I SAM-dependent methyltransferase [Dehalococcoidales bacterium]